MIDLSNLSTTELRELLVKVSEQIPARQKDEMAGIQKQMIALAESVGMTVGQVMGFKGAKESKPTKTVAPRYRHPEQSEHQWSGRGRQPRWVKEYLEKPGTTLESLLIK